ncbi:MAG: N-carbamoyl-D-amino-acid hydrolase [Hyphomicrobiaceae bacterium]|nr:MAG: N-carbamoyl-D-amino-acid hydrolase [Hyphomicrobiaceae bacterium]
MPRIVRIAGAQTGPIQRAGRRSDTLERLIALLRRSAAKGAELVVFPELAFTTFFPRWTLEADELGSYFERSMPNEAVEPLFSEAKRLGVGFYVGYAELTPEGRRFNSSIVVGGDGKILGKYRKVHLPGTSAPRPGVKYQQLEKRYFEYGDLGFPAFRAPQWHDAILGMMICNDRRWPESWRVLGLKGVELVLLGYNSAAYDPNGGVSESAELRTFHHKLAVQANAYMNATWAVAVAKAGVEDGAGLIGGSCIVDPDGLIVAETKTMGDEVIVADCDLDRCIQGKTKMFDFAAHRRPQWYGVITSQAGATPPQPTPKDARRP